MKFLRLIFLSSFLSIYFIGCISTSSQNKISSLNFSTILNFKIGTSTQSDIVKVLGEPSDSHQTDHYLVMNYNDSETDQQRLSLNISKTDKKLLNLFWMPKEGESENNLDHVKKSFKNSQFQSVEEKSKSSHMTSLGILFYIDKKAGVTIRYDKRRNAVEAIALYDSENRTTSSEL